MAQHHPRDYVLGQELRARILTTGAQTSGRHDLVDAFQLPDTTTPLHLHTRHEERLVVLEGACIVWVQGLLDALAESPAFSDRRGLDDIGMECRIRGPAPERGNSRRGRPQLPVAAFY